jgi:N-acetylneuraminic acid mutarotase
MCDSYQNGSYKLINYEFDPATNKWQAKTPTPLTRYGLSLVTYQSKVYLVGGFTGQGKNPPNTLVYDPTSDMWAEKAPMPSTRIETDAVVGEKIYVMGGHTTNPWEPGSPLVENEVYDVANDTWSELAPIPTAVDRSLSGVFDGKIYVVGGRTGQGYTTVDLNEVYDIATDLWTAKASIPYAVVKYASAVVDNKIYVIGGQDEFLHENMNVVFNQIYDTMIDAWSQGSQIPVAALSAVAGATTGEIAPKRLYVLGGYEGFMEPLDQNYIYDPEKDSWSLGAPMTTPRYGLALAVENMICYMQLGV